MDEEKILIHRLVIPSIEKGCIGFCKFGEKNAFEPNYKYITDGGGIGYIHINSPDKLYELAKKIGAMPPNKFREHYRFKPKENWNDYSWYFDRAIERALILSGIEYEIHNKKFLLYTESGFYSYTSIKPSQRFMNLYKGERA